MFWLMTLRPVSGHAGFAADPYGGIWSYWYRGSKGQTRRLPHRLKSTKGSSGYMVVNLRGNVRLVHMLVADAFVSPKHGHEYVDHINRDRSDNRASNLRRCTRAENNRNISKKLGLSSRYLGVYLDRRSGRFAASLMVNRVKLGGKTFSSEIAAALYRDRLAREHHGQFCSLNFPDADSNLYPFVELYSKVNS